MEIPKLDIPKYGTTIGKVNALLARDLSLYQKKKVYIYSTEHRSLIQCNVVHNKRPRLEPYAMTTIFQGDIPFLYVRNGRLIATTVRDTYMTNETNETNVTNELKKPYFQQMREYFNL